MTMKDGIEACLLALAAFAAMYGALVNWQLYRSQTDPDVLVYVTPDESGPSLILLVIHNVGRGLARDITFRWHKPPISAYGLTAEGARPPERITDGPLVEGLSELGPN